MMKKRLLSAAFAALLLAGPAQAGLFDDAQARKQIDDLKQETLGRINTINNAQFELSNQNEELRAEVARLRGQIEVLVNEIEALKSRQRDFYVDLDSRVRQLETNTQAPQQTPTTSGTNAGASTGGGRYDTALGYLKENRAAEALTEFVAFIDANPGSDKLPDANFWAGTAALQSRNVAASSKHFSTVLSRWPKSAVAPDAMLGLANGQIAIGDQRTARQTLQSLIDRYPSSNAAKTAKQHLSSSQQR